MVDRTIGQDIFITSLVSAVSKAVSACDIAARRSEASREVSCMGMLVYGGELIKTLILEWGQRVSQRMLRLVTQGRKVFPKLQESSAKTVGVISDKHVPDRARRIPERVFKVFQNVDFIVHAGDLVQLSVIEELERLAPVLVVYGNMDGPEVRGKLPKLDSFKVFDWRIGVTQNPGAHLGLGKMREIASTNGFNVLIYGHTHSSSIKWERDVLFINPGSPTNPSPPFLAKPSVALLRVTKESTIPKIVQI